MKILDKMTVLLNFHKLSYHKKVEGWRWWTSTTTPVNNSSI